MRKTVTFILFIFCTYLLQSTWSTVIPLGGYAPDMLLILVLSMAFMRGRRAGMIFGLICGILTDLVYMPFLGFSALFFVLAGYVAGSFYDVFFSENVKIPMGMAAIGEFLYGLSKFFVIFFLKEQRGFLSALTGSILPQTILTVLLTIPLYGIYYAFNRKIAVHELEEQQSPWLRK